MLQLKCIMKIQSLRGKFRGIQSRGVVPFDFITGLRLTKHNWTPLHDVSKTVLRPATFIIFAGVDLLPGCVLKDSRWLVCKLFGLSLLRQITTKENLFRSWGTIYFLVCQPTTVIIKNSLKETKSEYHIVLLSWCCFLPVLLNFKTCLMMIP